MSSNTVTRTMSDLTIYYDAEEDWTDDHDIVEFEETAPATATAAPVVATTPQAAPQAEQPPSRREEVLTLMSSIYNLNHFLPNQYEAIDAALNGDDIFLVFPKGEQRNISYMVPILYHYPKLTTIVIVPDSLYLLQQDDHNIPIHKIPTLFISKSKNTFKKNWIPVNVVDSNLLKNYSIVYMTFDVFAKCSLIIQELHQQNLLSRIIVDEAHCISQWGPDFIFGFLRITENIKSTYPTVPITALTAISNERIQLDIMHKLSIQDSCKIFKRSIFL